MHIKVVESFGIVETSLGSHNKNATQYLIHGKTAKRVDPEKVLTRKIVGSSFFYGDLCRVM